MGPDIIFCTLYLNCFYLHPNRPVRIVNNLDKVYDVIEKLLEGFYTDIVTALCRSIWATAPLLCFNIYVADCLSI
jgi:hypothetical protein